MADGSTVQLIHYSNPSITDDAGTADCPALRGAWSYYGGFGQNGVTFSFSVLQGLSKGEAAVGWNEQET